MFIERKYLLLQINRSFSLINTGTQYRIRVILSLNACIQFEITGEREREKNVFKRFSIRVGITPYKSMMLSLTGTNIKCSRYGVFVYITRTY